MKIEKSSSVVKKTHKLSRFKFAKHGTFITIGVVFALTLIGFVYHRYGAIQSQEQRNARIEAMLSDFETSVGNTTGHTITNMEEPRYCDYPSKSEIAIPLFDNGNGPLYCNIEAKGTIVAQRNDAITLTQQIAASARSALQKSGLTITQTQYVNNNGANGSVRYDVIYGSNAQVARCEIAIDTPFTLDNVNGASYTVSSLEYDFNCSQKSSKAYFKRD